MGGDKLCRCQYIKDKTGKEYFKFRVIHECSTNSSIYVWRRCEDCGELRLERKHKT